MVQMVDDWRQMLQTDITRACGVAAALWSFGDGSVAHVRLLEGHNRSSGMKNKVDDGEEIRLERLRKIQELLGNKSTSKSRK